MEIYTIGFTSRSAREFFTVIHQAGICRLLDIRLNNKSQLAGFSKYPDLSYFLEKLCSCTYEHDLELAPTKDMLSQYRQDHLWDSYETQFQALLASRHDSITARYSGYYFTTPTVLLCSEPTPDHCHRRLVAEYIANIHRNLKIVHL
ncbi:MAG: DUF488 domain-containing protein [Armatimonadota bacterium]